MNKNHFEDRKCMTKLSGKVESVLRGTSYGASPLF